jgi:CHAT domain-containing protein/Tfp pilus assembly protein PilF
MRGLAAAIFLILLAITTTDARAATGAAQAYCAKPVPTLASICSGIAAAKPEAFEALAGLLEHAGRYAQGAAVEAQAVALQQKAGAPAVAALARDLAALSRLDILAGDYPAAEKAAVQAVATAPSADPAAQSAALLAAGIADRAMGHYDLGAPKLRNALALRVTALGPDAPGTADVLDALADLLGNAGALAEAQADALKAVQIRVKSGGKTSADFAHSAVILALILRAGGHYADAEQLALQAQQAARQSLGADHPEYAKALNVLGIVYRAEGRIADAEYVTNIALGVQIKAFGKATPDIATTANNLALIYEQEGKLAKAEPLFRQVLQIRIETLGADHPDVGNTYDNLAGLMRRLGRLDEAEQDYEQAIAIQAAALGPDHPDVAEDLANLAYVLRMEGQFDQAEALLRRALSIRIRALPPGHPDIAATEVSLGDVLQAEGRSNDAEAAYLQALAIQEKSLGMHHAAVAITLNDLAALYRTANRIPEAVADYTKALEIQRAVLPPGDPDIAITLGNIADVLAFEGRFDEADRMQQQALKIRVDTLGPRHPLVATSLGNLAKLRRLQLKLGEAEKLQRQVVDIRLAAYGPDNPDVAQDYSDLAEILSDEGHTKPALEAMRKATAIYRARNAGADEQTPADADAERKAARFVFVNHVYLLEVAMHKLPRQSQALLAESFEVAQLAQNWSVGAVVQQMAARFATGTSDLARLVRQQQDTLDQVAKVDSLLDQLALLPPEKQDPSALDALRNQRSKLDDSLNDLATVIQQRFPEYAAATSLQPVTLKQIQHLLHPEEALVSYLLGGDSTFIWIVRPHSAALVKAPIGQQQILAMVRQLRAGLDPAVYALTGRMPIYDTTLAYQFYKSILAPARAKIGSATRLLIVADGPLQALPMNVLVLSPPKRPKPGAAPDYRKVDWLIRHYASAMLPSTSSLRALRSFARAPAAGQPFLGIGDPDLGEPLRRSSVRKLKTGVDVRLVNRLVPLPETANELRQIAGILKAPAANVIITQAATISRVRSLDLSQYRVVAFATHGLITGELRGLTEPAIVLTPDPEHGDNGLLRASEIAQLHFNADWVVLSACNTAASDGTIGAEGFSGLAKAFFYAGTRALVVSNWPVNSAASVQLTTNSVGMAASKHRVGKADALQHSMLQLLTKGNPFFAHPMMWAPFVIVGEGGPSAS